MEKAAVFDLDGTLVSYDTHLRFYWFAFRNIEQCRRNTLSSGIRYTRYALSVGPSAAIKKVFLPFFLRGLIYQETKAYVQPFAELVVNGMSRKVLQTIEERRYEDFKLVLASASPSFYVETVASLLSFDYCVATQMEEENGKWYLVEPQCKGVVKKHRIAELIPDIDWAGSIVYTDHVDDEPLMRVVGRCFWVKPGNIPPTIGNLEVMKVTWY